MKESSIDIYCIVGQNIKKFRKLNNLTQEELARETNLSYGFIKNLESKKVRATISIETLYMISKCLHIPLSSLLEIENENSL